MNGWKIYLIICIFISAAVAINCQTIYPFLIGIPYLYGCGWLYYKIFKWFIKADKEHPTPSGNKSFTIVKTEIIDIDTTYQVKGRLLASMIGKELFGDPGALYGAIHGTHTVEKNYILFWVKYSDGREGTIKAKYGSALYKQLIKYLD